MMSEPYEEARVVGRVVESQRGLLEAGRAIDMPGGGARPDWRVALGAGVFVFLAPGALVVGQVALGDGASVWYNAVLRGDIEPITVGRGTNIQDLSCVHTDSGYPTAIGEGVTVGHSCVLHGCTVGDGALIGMGSVLLNGCVIGEQCLVGARSLVTERKEFPPRTLIMGMPAKAERPLTDAEIADNKHRAALYVAEAAFHQAASSRGHSTRK